MNLVTIDIDKIKEEIDNYDYHRVWMENSLNGSPTQAKRTYLSELNREQEALKLLVTFIEKFKHQSLDESIAKLPVIEVKVTGRYRDGGSLDVIDKDGNEYHMAFRGGMPPKYNVIDINKKPVNANLIVVAEFTKQ